MKNKKKTIKRIAIFLAIAIPLGFFLYAGCNYYQGPDPYTDAEKYTIKASEERVMEVLSNFFKNNPSYELPVGSFLESSQRKRSDDGRRYKIYFYDKGKDEVLFVYVRGKYDDPNKTIIGLVSVLENNSVGDLEDIHTTIVWKDINHDLKGKENREVKKWFEERILSKIKSYLQ